MLNFSHRGFSPSRGLTSFSELCASHNDEAVGSRSAHVTMKKISSPPTQQSNSLSILFFFLQVRKAKKREHRKQETTTSKAKNDNTNMATTARPGIRFRDLDLGLSSDESCEGKEENEQDNSIDAGSNDSGARRNTSSTNQNISVGNEDIVNDNTNIIGNNSTTDNRNDMTETSTQQNVDNTIINTTIRESQENASIIFRLPFDMDEYDISNRDDFLWDDDFEEANDGCNAEGVPDLKNWVEVDEDEISMTVATSRQRLWKYAEDEITTIRDNISSLTFNINDCDWMSDNLQKLYQFLFGTHSTLYRLFHDNLGIDKPTYLQFLQTFFLSCKNNRGVSAIHAMFDIDKKYYMSVDEYNGLWKKIDNLRSTNSSIAFWQALEDAINNNIKRIVFQNSSESVPHLVAIDDDKVHFAWTLSSNADGLKRCHHAKDNRRGFTVHTAAFPASQIPIGAYFQRDGESVQTTYLRMLKKMFGNGSDVLPDLRNITLASDRGYWMPRFLFQQLLEAGANIQGTVKRVS